MPRRISRTGPGGKHTRKPSAIIRGNLVHESLLRLSGAVADIVQEMPRNCLECGDLLMCSACNVPDEVFELRERIQELAEEAKSKVCHACCTVLTCAACNPPTCGTCRKPLTCKQCLDDLVEVAAPMTVSGERLRCPWCRAPRVKKYRFLDMFFDELFVDGGLFDDYPTSCDVCEGRGWIDQARLEEEIAMLRRLASPNPVIVDLVTGPPPPPGFMLAGRSAEPRPVPAPRARKKRAP